jgi:uncharacterized protein
MTEQGRRFGPVGGALGLAAAVAIAWLASPDLPSPARLLTVLLVTFLPALMLLQGRALRDVDPAEMPRPAIYLSSSLTLWLLAGITLWVASQSGFTRDMLGLVALPPLPLLAWSVAATTGGVAILALGRTLRTRETSLVEHLMPSTPGEKLAFVGVSVTAGVCEELIFRAFLIPALTVVLGSLAGAVFVSSLVFGMLHAYQGSVGIVRTGILGLLLAIPFLATGSIVPSIIAHFALDLLAGIWLTDWLLRREAAAG